MQPSFLTVCVLSLVLTFLTSCNLLDNNRNTTLTVNTRPLSSEEMTRIKRFLHPMPQELRLSDFSYEFSPGECGIKTSPAASLLEKQMIDDFKGRWRNKYGSELKDNDRKLTIVAGVFNNSSVLQKTAAKGVFDAKYLSECKNSEQAYVLTTVSEGETIIVYIAANDNKGLYYGLLTFEQLLNALSNGKKLVLPHCRIVDWPDVRGRGSWVGLGGVHAKNIDACEKRIKDFSELKLNMIEALILYPNKLDKHGDIQVAWKFPKKIINLGKLCAVDVFPSTGHLPSHLKRQPVMKKKFPNTLGVNSAGEQKGLIMCLSQPGTREYLTEYMVAIAKQFDLAGVWMSEVEGPTGVCHCKECKGDLRKAFVKETRLLMEAYRKAKKINPKFRIILALTQGSYPHHFEMLKYIPKEVVLDFYSGIMTYRTTFQKYNLPPSIQEIQRMGYKIGSIPSPVPWATNIFGPFQTPQYLRLLCGEAEDRGLEFVDAFLWPNPFFYELNSEAMAEFLWNSNGRTAKEFTVAWATRKGLKAPDETAAIIGMMEYPERGFRNCRFWQMVLKISNFVTRKERPNRSTLRGFEFATYGEISRVLSICEEAVVRSEKLKNPELLAGTKLMRCAITIIERYAYCISNVKDSETREQVIDTIRTQLELYPQLFENWFKTKKPSKYARRCIDNSFHKKWKKMLQEIKDAKISTEAKKLLNAMKQRKLNVYKLGPDWKFKSANKGIGLSEKWYMSSFDDNSWSTIKAGLGYGWEKQGHAELTGHAWYRREIKIPKDMRGKKHLYLFFGGVDEDAEVFVNGKKIFTHDFKSMKVAPASTWDKPFSFDVKSNLNKKDNIIAVRVFNRTGMGGIWRPVYLISTDATADRKDLRVVVNQFENENFNDLY